LTLRAVGAAAGVSRSAPYRHFADKTELERALAARSMTELAQKIREQTRSGQRHTRLRRGCGAYLRHAIEQPHHYLLIFGDAPIANPVAEVSAAADDAMAAVEEITHAAQSDGTLVAGPTREIATVLWVLLHGLAQLRITGHLREPRTVQGDAGVDRLLKIALTSLRPHA
jgi:AcrR family transcriptional regulator